LLAVEVEVEPVVVVAGVEVIVLLWELAEVVRLLNHHYFF
jgi:hypothetical protein